MTSEQSSQRVQTQQYEVHGNLAYPLEAALVESFVKAIIDDIEEAENLTWWLLLNSWIAMMVSYLEVNNDILDNCADEQAKEWYSTRTLAGFARPSMVHGISGFRNTLVLGKNCQWI